VFVIYNYHWCACYKKTSLFPALVFFWVLFCCCLPLLTTHMVKFRDFCSKCFNWLYMVAIFHYQQYYSLGRQGSYLSELTLESSLSCLRSSYHAIHHNVVSQDTTIGMCLICCLFVFILSGSRQLLQKRQFFHSHRAQVNLTFMHVCTHL